MLDVGCGTGWFTRRLSALPGMLVTGIDLNAEWLAFARSRDAHSTYIQADALALPFSDNSFDQVLSVAALCFTTDWHKATECGRPCSKLWVAGQAEQHPVDRVSLPADLLSKSRHCP